MAHIDLGIDETLAPGIRGLLAFRPETAGPLMALANALLHSSVTLSPGTLSPGERELIAAYVSGLNECQFCRASHSAFAAAQLDEGVALVEQVRRDPDSAPISAKLRALLRIAGAVQKSGREVTPELVDAAREADATDVEIHDTVLIAAAFCMYNRYVDGLGTLAISHDPADYANDAERIVSYGYQAPTA
jgi:uncharacterized peroxidase-related enzyme